MDTKKCYRVLPKPLAGQMSDNFKLSEEQLKFYNDNGYLVIKNLIDFPSVVSYRQRFLDIVRGKVPPSFLMRVIKEPLLINKTTKPEEYVHKLQEVYYDDVLLQYALNPHMYSVLTQMIGDNITAINGMLINKPPGTLRHPPHQDIYYFPFRPADKIIATWTAIDDVTVENGALYVVPGSHKSRTIYEHVDREASMKLYLGIDPENELAAESKRVHVELAPGDTILFHPYLIHGSGPNTSKNYRKAITYHFMNSQCECIDVMGTVQEKGALEVVEQAKKQGVILTFGELWQLKSREITSLKSKL